MAPTLSKKRDDPPKKGTKTKCTLKALNHRKSTTQVLYSVQLQRNIDKLGHKQMDYLVYWGLTPQQQPGSYQGSEMMIMKSVFWWRKPEYPEETTGLWQVTDETFHTYGLRPVRRLKLINRWKHKTTFKCGIPEHARHNLTFSWQ